MASELDFTSPLFNPLKALYANGLQPPVPNVPIFNNINEYAQCLKLGKPIPKRGKASVKTQGSGGDGNLAQRLKNIADNKVRSRNRDPSRLAHLMKMKSKTDGIKEKVAMLEKTKKRHRQKNVLERMEGQYKEGPLSILYNCIEKKKQLRVWTRRLKGIRGVCVGYLIAYDKHLNLAMMDVDEMFSIEEEVEVDPKTLARRLEKKNEKKRSRRRKKRCLKNKEMTNNESKDDSTKIQRDSFTGEMLDSVLCETQAQHSICSAEQEFEFNLRTAIPENSINITTTGEFDGLEKDASELDTMKDKNDDEKSSKSKEQKFYTGTLCKDEGIKSTDNCVLTDDRMEPAQLSSDRVGIVIDAEGLQGIRDDFQDQREFCESSNQKNVPRLKHGSYCPNSNDEEKTDHENIGSEEWRLKIWDEGINISETQNIQMEEGKEGTLWDHENSGASDDEEVLLRIWQSLCGDKEGQVTPGDIQIENIELRQLGQTLCDHESRSSSSNDEEEILRIWKGLRADEMRMKDIQIKEKVNVDLRQDVCDHESRGSKNKSSIDEGERLRTWEDNCDDEGEMATQDIQIDVVDDVLRQEGTLSSNESSGANSSGSDDDEEVMLRIWQEGLRGAEVTTHGIEMKEDELKQRTLSGYRSNRNSSGDEGEESLGTQGVRDGEVKCAQDIEIHVEEKENKLKQEGTPSDIERSSNDEVEVTTQDIQIKEVKEEAEEEDGLKQEGTLGDFEQSRNIDNEKVMVLGIRQGDFDNQVEMSTQDTQIKEDENKDNRFEYDQNIKYGNSMRDEHVEMKYLNNMDIKQAGPPKEPFEGSPLDSAEVAKTVKVAKTINTNTLKSGDARSFKEETKRCEEKVVGTGDLKIQRSEADDEDTRAVTTELVGKDVVKYSETSVVKDGNEFSCGVVDIHASSCEEGEIMNSEEITPQGVEGKPFHKHGGSSEVKIEKSKDETLTKSDKSSLNEVQETQLANNERVGSKDVEHFETNKVKKEDEKEGEKEEGELTSSNDEGHIRCCEEGEVLSSKVVGSKVERVQRKRDSEKYSEKEELNKEKGRKNKGETIPSQRSRENSGREVVGTRSEAARHEKSSRRVDEDTREEKHGRQHSSSRVRSERKREGDRNVRENDGKGERKRDEDRPRGKTSENVARSRGSSTKIKEKTKPLPLKGERDDHQSTGQTCQGPHPLEGFPGNSKSACKRQSRSSDLGSKVRERSTNSTTTERRSTNSSSSTSKRDKTNDRSKSDLPTKTKKSSDEKGVSERDRKKDERGTRSVKGKENSSKQTRDSGTKHVPKEKSNIRKPTDEKEANEKNKEEKESEKKSMKGKDTGKNTRYTSIKKQLPTERSSIRKSMDEKNEAKEKNKEEMEREKKSTRGKEYTGKNSRDTNIKKQLTMEGSSIRKSTDDKKEVANEKHEEKENEKKSMKEKERNSSKHSRDSNNSKRTPSEKSNIRTSADEKKKVNKEGNRKESKEMDKKENKVESEKRHGARDREVRNPDIKTKPSEKLALKVARDSEVTISEKLALKVARDSEVTISEKLALKVARDSKVKISEKALKVVRDSEDNISEKSLKVARDSKVNTSRKRRRGDSDATARPSKVRNVGKGFEKDQKTIKRKEAKLPGKVITVRVLKVERDKALVLKRRHVNQLFIRGDNVVMVAYENTNSENKV